MLAYSYDDLSGGNGVGVISLDGSTSAKRLDFAMPTTHSTPDSRAFFYIKNEGASPTFGEPPKRITYFNNDVIRSFDLSRDGKQLVTDRGTANRDMLLIWDVR